MKLYLTYGQEEAPEGFEKQYGESYFLRSVYLELKYEEIQGNQILDKIKDLVPFFESVYKHLEVGGKAVFSQYYYRHPMAYMSPLSIRGLSEHSLSWLSKDWRKANPNLSPDCDFDFEVQYSMATDPELENRSADSKAFWLAQYSSVISAIQFSVIKK